MNKAYERPPEETIADYQRRQEILFDVAMELGRSYALLSESVRNQLMDQLNGSRGLFDLVLQWVEEFDREWETSENDPERQYLESVDEFTQAKLLALVNALPAQAPPDRLDRVRSTYLKRFDEHVRKIVACETLKSVLLPRQHAWLAETRKQLLVLTEHNELNHLTHCAATLVGMVIHSLYTQGFSYMKISGVLGISSNRTSTLASNYEAAVRFKEIRTDNGRETTMPWL